MLEFLKALGGWLWGLLAARAGELKDIIEQLREQNESLAERIEKQQAVLDTLPDRLTETMRLLDAIRDEKDSLRTRTWQLEIKVQDYERRLGIRPRADDTVKMDRNMPPLVEQAKQQVADASGVVQTVTGNGNGIGNGNGGKDEPNHVVKRANGNAPSTP